MRFLFPRAKFASTATIEAQSASIINEANEVWWLDDEPLMHRDGHVLHPADPPERFVEETLDCIHSCETLIRMLTDQYPHLDLDAAVENVRLKNEKRGYYEGEED